MASLKITASSLLSYHSLKLGRHGVHFRQNPVFSFGRFFAYEDIECVLMRADGQLSFQADGQVFSIPTRRHQRRHTAVVEALLERLNATIHESERTV